MGLEAQAPLCTRYSALNARASKTAAVGQADWFVGLADWSVLQDPLSTSAWNTLLVLHSLPLSLLLHGTLLVCYTALTASLFAAAWNSTGALHSLEKSDFEVYLPEA